MNKLNQFLKGFAFGFLVIILTTIIILSIISFIIWDSVLLEMLFEIDMFLFLIRSSTFYAIVWGLFAMKYEKELKWLRQGL